MGEECLFLSKEWIYRATRLIEEAKRVDEDFRRKTRDFTLSVAYVVKDIPPILRDMYSSDEVYIYIELSEGRLKKLAINPREKVEPDFTVESQYEIARDIFSGKLSLGAAFVQRKIKVSPFMKLYANPAFTAKSLVTASAILKILSKIPTTYP